MSKPITVSSCAYVHASDIDPTIDKQGSKWETLVNVCTTRAQTALDRPTGAYGQYHRNALYDLFGSLRSTHRSIRLLLALGDDKPESVDALALARLQLEALYSICLMTESPQHVDTFVRDAWEKQYVRYLLGREETKGLLRFAESNVPELSRLLKLSTVWNVSEPERLTIEYDHRDIPPPAGFVRRPIPRFPTPGALIRKLPSGTKRLMLERLYFDYQHLCSFAHGLPIASMAKGVFDGRSPLRQLFSEAEIKRNFEQEVCAAAQVYSFLSVVQSAAELTTLYPNNMELVSGVADAWNELMNAHLLVNAIWNIRTKALFGVVG